MSMFKLWEKQIGQCWYCGSVIGRDIDRILSADGKLIFPFELRAGHVDHQHPKSRGGLGGANLVLACAPCNMAKGARTVEEYRAALQAASAEPIEFLGDDGHFDGVAA